MNDCDYVTLRAPERYIPTPQAVRYVTTTPAYICNYSPWGQWSPCSKTCGESATQVRTRTLLNYENSKICVERVERRPCDIMPCLRGNYNYHDRM